MRRFQRALLLGGIVLVFLPVALLVFAQLRLTAGAEEIEREWATREVAPLGDFGTTDTLSILPLVDWHTSDESLVGEAGVSYLVRTDEQTILFDTGFNREERDPAPLTHNMRALGVSIEEVDTVFVSHLHPDHVGGFRWFGEGTFSIGNEQPPLGQRQVFVPVEMTYPGSRPRVSREPTVLGPGVASIGTIGRQLFLGRVDEQALAVHVRGRGVVLIVGCGHQTLDKILDRTREIADADVFGVVGGLHYPLPEGRGTMLGIDVQYRLASGDGPFAPIRMADVEKDLDRLQRMGVGVVGVGGHDSGDAVIARFAEALGPRYRHVRVGEEIRIGTGSEAPDRYAPRPIPGTKRPVRVQ